MIPTREIKRIEAALKQAHLNTGSRAAPLGRGRFRTSGGAIVIGFCRKLWRPAEASLHARFVGDASLLGDVDRLAVGALDIDGPGLADLRLHGQGQRHVVERRGLGIAVLIGPVEELQDFRAGRRIGFSKRPVPLMLLSVESHPAGLWARPAGGAWTGWVEWGGCR